MTDETQMPDQDDAPIEVDDRVPPHDLDAEAAILSALMVDPIQLPSVAEFLQPACMYSEAHRRMLETIYALAAEGKPFDVLHVAGRLRDTDRLAQVGGMPYVTEVLNASPAVANTRPYALRVHGLWRVRTVQERCRQAVAEGYLAGQEPSEFCERTAKAMHELAFVTGTGGELEPMRATLDAAFAELQAADASGKPTLGLPTGLERLDRVLGGLHDGELTILAARPGRGKSSAALQWALHAAFARMPTAFFSLEMPKKQLAMRAGCVEARVDVSRWRTGTIGDRDWPRLTAAVKQIRQWPLYIDDTAGLTAMGLRARLRRFSADLARANAGRPRLVVVDYLQLMHATPGARRESRERAVAEVAQDLKEIAKEFNLPVIAPCQMNRAIEQGTTRRPRLSDLRESGNIEQAADTVIFIHETKERNVVEFVVEKQRNGPNDIVCARFDRQYTRFDNLAEGEYPGDWHDEAAQ